MHAKPFGMTKIKATKIKATRTPGITARDFKRHIETPYNCSFRPLAHLRPWVVHRREHILPNVTVFFTLLCSKWPYRIIGEVGYSWTDTKWGTEASSHMILECIFEFVKGTKTSRKYNPWQWQKLVKIKPIKQIEDPEFYSGHDRQTDTHRHGLPGIL